MNTDSMIKSCCFSGHRNLPCEKTSEIRKRLLEKIKELAENGCTEFVSGGAVGFDLMAAEAVLEIKREYPRISLVMALPCRDQHIKMRQRDKNKYQRILESADEVIYLCESYVTGCMHLRNKYMVKRCDFCVAYLENRSSGTGYTVECAKALGKGILNLAYMV